MKTIRSVFSILLLLLLVSSSYADTQRKIAFKWAFLKQASSGKTETVDFSRDVSFQAGDAFKILLESESPCCIYLFNEGVDNSLTQLFPLDSARNLDSQKMVSIPEDPSDYLSLENLPGTDRFFLLASASPLPKLEKLMKEYRKWEAASGASPTKFLAAKKNLSDEIHTLRNSTSKYTVYAEKPTSIAGTSRKLPGATNAAEIGMMSVEASEFYARILKIQH